MNRIAFIVVTPNCPGLKPLPGALDDAGEWKSYLTSPEGGAWKEERGEIIILTDPAKAPLLIDLYLKSKPQLDYALMAFSGHGDCIQNQQGQEAHLYLSANDSVTEKDFTLHAKRELLILDACREFHDERIIVKAAAANARMMILESLEEKLMKSRQLFDAAIAANPLGRSIVYSCSVDENASDRPSFTEVLLGKGIEKAKEEKYAKALTIMDVFPSADLVAQSFKLPQHPVYDAGRRITHLPFAVSV